MNFSPDPEEREEQGEQLPLDGLPDQPALGPWARGSDTSRQAALDNFPRSGTQRRAVLEAVAAAGHTGATRDELGAQLGLGYESINPRVWELIHLNWIVQTARTRPTRQGGSAHVLVLSEKAEPAFVGAKPKPDLGSVGTAVPEPVASDRPPG